MNKELQKLLDRAEELEWCVQQECGNVYLFSKFSPLGQDFNISVDTEDDPNLFLHNLDQTYLNFDVSEETYYWLDSSGHGKNGAPYDMKDLYEDMEACEAMIMSLHAELETFFDTLMDE